MKISVLISSYNNEKFINECIDSVIKQNYKDIEIIICDDGSNDNSQEIISNYTKNNKNIKKYLYKTNSGFPGRVKNKAISMAKGDYITFMDGDDIMPSNTLMHYANVLHNNNYDIIIGNTYKLFKEYKVSLINNSINQGDININRDLNYIKTIGVWGRIYKSSLIKEIKFVEDNLYDDHLFTAKVNVLANNIMKIDFDTYYWRVKSDFVNNKSLSEVKNINNIKKRIEIINQTNEVYEKSSLSELAKNSWYDYIYNGIFGYEILQLNYKNKDYLNYIIEYKKRDFKFKERNLNLYNKIFFKTINNSIILLFEIKIINIIRKIIKKR